MIMNKLTKVQHRAAIKRLVEDDDDLASLRMIQTVAEMLQEELHTCGNDSTLTGCDALRMLLHLIEEKGNGSEAYSALYDIWKGKGGHDYE